MIRRGFWLAVGAAAGIYGYRRVSAVSRRLSASLNPTGSAQGAGQGRRTAIRAARETFRFTRDVREGMDLYMARHSASAGPTLSADRESTDRGSTDRGSADRGPADRGPADQSTTHEPEDGH